MAREGERKCAFAYLNGHDLPKTKCEGIQNASEANRFSWYSYQITKYCTPIKDSLPGPWWVLTSAPGWRLLRAKPNARNRQQRDQAAVLIIAPVVVVVIRVAVIRIRIATIKSVISEAATKPASESAMAKSSAAAEVAEPSPAKSSAAETTSAEPTPVETATYAASVKATSAEAPAVAASKPTTATASQRFVVGEHQSAGRQRNDADRHFFPHDILSCCNSRVAQDSTLMHRRPRAA